MSLPAASPIVSYVGNNSTVTPYAFAFKVLDASHVKLYIDNVLSADSISVSGVGSDSGVTITTSVAYTPSQTVTFKREVPVLQDTDLVEGGRLREESLESGFDYQTMISQQLAENLTRTVTTAPGAVAPGGNVVKAVSTTLGQDASGNWVNRTASEESTHLGIGASVTAAAASATAAATSATNAASSATAAAASATSAETSNVNASNAVLDLAEKSFARALFYTGTGDSVITGDVVISLPGAPDITIKNSARPYVEDNAISGVGAKLSDLWPDIVNIIRGNYTDFDTSIKYGNGIGPTISNPNPITSWDCKTSQSIYDESMLVELIYYGSESSIDLSAILPSPYVTVPTTLTPPSDLPFLDKVSSTELSNSHKLNLRAQIPGIDQTIIIDGPEWPTSPLEGLPYINRALKRKASYIEGSWREEANWTGDGFLQSTVGLNATLAYSPHQLGRYGSDQPTFRARRDNDDDELDFYGGELGSTRFFDWAGTEDIYLVKLYDQLGSGKDLIQPNETRQYKIAASGALIDWVAHSGGSGADYYLLNAGLAAVDNLSAFVAYSSREAAAADTQTATMFSLGDGNVTQVQALYSASGAAGVTGEGITLDVRQSSSGTQRIAATYGASAGEYDRAADTLEIIGVGFTASGVWLYQDGSEITLDITSTAAPPDVDTGDFSPSSGTYTDIIRVGATSLSGSPTLQKDSTFEAIVFYDSDQEANQLAIHDGISAAITNQFRVMTFNVRDFNGTTTADAQYTVMENFVQRYQPDILALMEIDAGSVSLITGDFATDNGYTATYFGQAETRGIVLLSKFPITYSELIDFPDGKTFDRPARYIEVDYHGRPFGIYGVHLATFCESAPCSASAPDHETQRPEELEIVGIHKEARLAQNSRLEFIVMGDFNGDSATQTHVTSIASYGGAPSTITYPITVKTGAGATEGFPETQLTAYGLTALNSQNLDGNDSTLWTTTPNAALTYESHVDEIAYSSGLSVLGHEIGDSEATQTGGITKYGGTLTSTDGRNASDHKPVIADIAF